MATSSISPETQLYLASRTPEEIEEILQAFRSRKSSKVNFKKTNNTATIRILKKNQNKTPGIRNSRTAITTGVKRPLNSFVAFRSYYSTIFNSMQQKNVSGLMHNLWKYEPFQSTWALLAKAYTLFRDHFGAPAGSLGRFLEIACEFLKMIKPEKYLETLGWTFTETEAGKTLCRTFTQNVQAVAPKQSITVSDIMDHCKEAGFVTDFSSSNLVDPSLGSSTATLTMSVLPSPAPTPYQAGPINSVSRPQNWTGPVAFGHSNSAPATNQSHPFVYMTNIPPSLRTPQQIAFQHIFGTPAWQASHSAANHQNQSQSSVFGILPNGQNSSVPVPATSEIATTGHSSIGGTDSSNGGVPIQKLKNEPDSNSNFESSTMNATGSSTHTGYQPASQIKVGIGNIELTEEMLELFRVLENTGGQHAYDDLFAPDAPPFVNFEFPDNSLFEDSIDFNAGLDPNFFDK